MTKPNELLSDRALSQTVLRTSRRDVPTLKSVIPGRDASRRRPPYTLNKVIFVTVRSLLSITRVPLRKIIFFLVIKFLINGTAHNLQSEDSLLADSDQRHIIVVANSNSPDSIATARYYLEKRKIPEENLLLLSTSTKETINRDEYLETIHNPLLIELYNRKLIEGLHSNQKDQSGRLLYAISKHSIRHLVLCGSIPLKISHDANRTDRTQPENAKKAYTKNNAAVDSELSLLFFTSPTISSYQLNPVFKKETIDTPEQRALLKVARLSGPSNTAVKQMIDSALEAEQNGLKGRVYIDKGGPHAHVDEWLEQTEKFLRPLNFDIATDSARKVLTTAHRFDAPALYFGWYASNVTGPFLLPAFRFPPGAIAVHIHSFSADTLKDPYRNWCGPLIARNVAVTVGNVYEPYTHLIHRVDLFVEKLVEGWTVGDAAYYALPALSWHSILIGDPLYRPFKVTLDEQLKRLDEDKENPSRYDAYTVIRKMNALQQTQTREAALAFGSAYTYRLPDIALRLRLANDYFATDRDQDALQNLQFINRLHYLKSSEWMLVKETADLLAKKRYYKQAIALYTKLIAIREIDSETLTLLLKDGIRLAELSGDWENATKWRALLSKK